MPYYIGDLFKKVPEFRELPTWVQGPGFDLTCSEQVIDPEGV